MCGREVGALGDSQGKPQQCYLRVDGACVPIIMHECVTTRSYVSLIMLVIILFDS